MIYDILLFSFISSMISIGFDFVLKKPFILRSYYVALKLFTSFYDVNYRSYGVRKGKPYVPFKFSIFKKIKRNKTVVTLDNSNGTQGVIKVYEESLDEEPSRKQQPFHKYMMFHILGGCIYCTNFYITLLIYLLFFSFLNPILIFTVYGLNIITFNLYFKYAD